MVSPNAPEHVFTVTCRICGEAFTKTVAVPPDKARAERSAFVHEVATEHQHDAADLFIVSMRQT